MITTLLHKLKISVFVAAGIVAIGLASPAPAAMAIDCGTGGTDAGKPACKVQQGVTKAGGAGQDLQPQIQNAINVLLFIIGVVAVIMIILGGLRYILSNGDSAQITSAKNTILYAVIGLVVALLAYAIVNFVVVQFVA
ncbi:MAG: pilin [Patescibacteria group bacterium]